MKRTGEVSSVHIMTGRGPPRAQLLWTPFVALLVLVSAGGAVAASSPTPHASTALVIAIQQSPYTVEQAAFTVGVEVVNASAVSVAYFTFCQLSSPLCYLPVAMSPNGSNWLSGTTHVMSSYSGMTVGVKAGYNITVDYHNGTNLTEPSLPNAYTSLSVAQEVCAPPPCVGAYMFEMSVGPNVYNLTGAVTDSTTGAPVVGATVSLTPGTNTSVTGASGGYAFTGLVNGSYSVSVSEAGYTTQVKSVSIDGNDAVQTVPLASSSAPPSSGRTSASSGPFSGTLAWVAIAVAIVVVLVLLGALLLRRRRSPPQPTSVPGAKPPTQP